MGLPRPTQPANRQTSGNSGRWRARRPVCPRGCRLPHPSRRHSGGHDIGARSPRRARECSSAFSLHCRSINSTFFLLSRIFLVISLDLYVTTTAVAPHRLNKRAVIFSPEVANVHVGHLQKCLSLSLY